MLNFNAKIEDEFDECKNREVSSLAKANVQKKESPRDIVYIYICTHFSGFSFRKSESIKPSGGSLYIYIHSLIANMPN